MLAVIVLAGCLFLSGAAGASHITIDNLVMDTGGSATADVMIDEILAESWQGWQFQAVMADPAVARVNTVTYPSGMYTFSDTTTLPFTTGHFGGIDLTDPPGTLPSGGKKIRLATVTVTGLSPGTTTMKMTINTIDGRNGSDLRSLYTITSPAITVRRAAVAAPSPVMIPGQSAAPADNDNDGLCEDLDGDGAVTFGDVSLYYYNFHWIESNEPVTLFDFDGNGGIDFGDIVMLNDRT